MWVNKASQKFVEMAVAQQKMAQLQALLKDLQEAKKEMAKSETGAFTFTGDRQKFESQINDYTNQLTGLQGQVQNLTVELNQLAGHIITNFHEQFSASIPFSLNPDSFNKISQEEEMTMRAKLLVDGTVDISRFSSMILSGKDKKKLSMLDPENKDGIWKKISSTAKVRLRSRYDLAKILKKAGYKSVEGALQDLTGGDARMMAIVATSQANEHGSAALRGFERSRSCRWRRGNCRYKKDAYCQFFWSD